MELHSSFQTRRNKINKVKRGRFIITEVVDFRMDLTLND